MIRFEFVVLLICFLNISGYSQQADSVEVVENQSIFNILEAFKKQYQYSFSYDVEAVKNVKLKIDQKTISIDSLLKEIKEQTQFILQKVDDHSYILVENDETIEICGIVVDAASTFELTQATILNNNNAIKLTDERGYFRLRLRPKDSISISYLGYDIKTIKASAFSGSSCDTIRLNPEIQSLSEVVINEYLTTGVQKNKDASINVSTKKLRILPGLVEPDVLQSLQLLPGVNSPTEDPAGLYIRGGTPDQNLVLWDGIKMYHNGHFFNQISTFNPYIVKNVKVYRGGTSVRYGDRISGAVIIESDDDLIEKIKIGGGVNFTHADIFAKVPLSEKIGVMAAFRRSTTDVYRNIAYNNLVRKVFQNTRADIPDSNVQGTLDREAREDDFSFSDTNIKLVWHPDEQNTIKFSGIFAENRLDNIRNEADTITSFNRINDILKLRNGGASLNWRKEYSNNIIQKTNVYFSIYDTRYKIIGSNTNSRQTFIFNENNQVKDIGAEYSLAIPLAPKQTLGVGYQFVYNEANYNRSEIANGVVDVDLEDEIRGEGNNHTLFSEYTYKSPKLYMNFGLRGSYLSNTDQFFIEPRMFSSVEVLKNFRLTTSAELKNQQLNRLVTFGSIYNQIEGLPVADNVWLLSGKIRNDDSVFVPVIKSMQFTFGSLYTINGWNFDLEAYYKKLTDVTSINNFVLEVASADTDNVFEIGKEERIGFDFLLKKRIQNYRFWIGYSLSKALVTFPSIQQNAFSGNFDQRHVLNISQTLKVNNFEFALGWNYATGRPFTRLLRDVDNIDDGIRIDPKGINSSRFKDYHRLDASAVYRFNFKTKKTWGGMIGFSIRNIYNRKNTITQGFSRREDENGIFVESFENKSLQLTPDVVIRFNF